MTDTSKQSPFADFAVPDHIRNLHVTWLNATRYYLLQCENLGILTIGQMLDADQEDLRLLLIDGDKDAAYLSKAISVLIARHPEPFDVEAAKWADVAIEFSRSSSAIVVKAKQC